MDFVKKAFSIFKVDVGAHGLSYLLRIIIAGLLGPVSFGIFSLIHLIPEYGEKLLRFSVDDASIHISGTKKYDPGEVFFNSAAIMFSLSFIPIILFLWQTDNFYKFFLKGHSVDPKCMWVTLASIPFIFLFRSVIKMLLFLEKVSACNNLNLFTSLTGYILGICFIFFFKTGVYGIFLALFFTHFIGSIISIVTISKTIHPKLRLRFDLIKELFIYGSKIQIPNTFLYLLLRIDMLIVAFFLTVKEVGYYALAVSLAEVLRKIPNAFLFLLYSRASRLPEEEAVVLTIKSCRNAFIILCFSSLPFYFLLKTIIMPLLNQDFTPIVYPFLTLLPGVIALGIGQLMLTHFYGKGHPLKTLKPVMTGFIINVLINFWLVPKIGILGAALASSISYIVFSLLLIKMFQDKRIALVREFFIPTKDDFMIYDKFLRLEIYEKLRSVFAK